jgi:outer membrane protein OmpA-like peptidoglycan-associated protein
MSTPPAQVSELALEVKGCETVVLTIQATAVSTPEPTQPGTGLGRIEISLVQHQDPSKPVTTIGSVILRPQNPTSPVIPVAIATSGQAAGTGAVDDVAAGQYTIELLPVIYFEVGKSAWLPSEKGKLDDMVELLKRLGDRGLFSLFITGLASVEGNPFVNRDLSEKRALAVKDWLKPRVSSRIDMLAGRGDLPAKQEVDPLDRRVELVLVPARGT